LITDRSCASGGLTLQKNGERGIIFLSSHVY
jgi:hypothetical protein